MKHAPPDKLNRARVRTGPLAGDDSDGMCGAFRVIAPTGATLAIVAANAADPRAEGWEHVSVSLPNRCPTWPEMCFVKALFWEPEETVVQFHPPESSYVNCYPYALHMWRDTRSDPRMPPIGLV